MIRAPVGLHVVEVGAEVFSELDLAVKTCFVTDELVTFGRWFPLLELLFPTV